VDILEPNNTCDIYKRSIHDLRTRGDIAALSEMVETWYSRCDFGKDFQGQAICDLGVTTAGVVWIRTTEGTVEFCQERNRWRLVQEGEEGQCQYAMARIAEITHVPFAYLCGVRDAVAIINRIGKDQLCESVKDLGLEHAKLCREIKKKQIAVDAVVVDLDESSTEERLVSRDYPDAPVATFTWHQLRSHFRDEPGVYFAWASGRVVYVGATEVGMWKRFGSTHKSVNKKDRFSFVKLPRHEVYFAETVYIARYAPDRNACVAQAMKKRVGGQRGSKAQSQNA
jgi:hypothetical protein